MRDAWKLKRELLRVGQQLRAIPEAVYEPFLQRRHDRHMRVDAPVVAGAVAQSERIALILIYQPSGLCDSVIELCADFIKSGFSPFLVSNTALSEPDMQKLLAVTWRILLRRNFGYDFGGYRDGILNLFYSQITPEQLVVMNDSVWCPVNGDMSFISQADARQADVVGGVMRWRDDSNFLESYFYHIKKAAFVSSAFQQYWKKYRLTSNKYMVIRRGERGFTAAMQSNNVSVDALYQSDDFCGKLATQSPEFLCHTLTFASYRDSHDDDRGQQLLNEYSDSSTWRDKAVAHVEAVLNKEVFNSSFCYASVKLFDFPFLKKSQDPINIRWRNKYTQAVEQGVLQSPPHTIWREFSG